MAIVGAHELRPLEALSRGDIFLGQWLAGEDTQPALAGFSQGFQEWNPVRW